VGERFDEVSELNEWDLDDMGMVRLLIFTGDDFASASE